MDNKSIYSMVLESDDIRWQTIIYDLIRTGKVDPWDLDISTLAKEYTKVLRNLEKMNFRMCGKVVLAAALLLKIKTHNLGLQQFMELIDADGEALEALPEDSEEPELPIVEAPEGLEITPRLDQQKTRKVTVFELMDALKRAISKEDQRDKLLAQKKQEVPTIKKHKPKQVDIYRKIRQVYVALKMLAYRTKKNTVEFRRLIPSTEKKDIVWTFMPLLHLSNDQKVRLHQGQPFDKIFVELCDNGPAEFKKIETNASQLLRETREQEQS